MEANIICRVVLGDQRNLQEVLVLIGLAVEVLDEQFHSALAHGIGVLRGLSRLLAFQDVISHLLLAVDRIGLHALQAVGSLHGGDGALQGTVVDGEYDVEVGVLLQPVVHDGHALVIQAGAGLLGDDLIALVAFQRVLEALQAVDGALDLGVAEHQDLGAVERFEHVLAAQPAL